MLVEPGRKASSRNEAHATLYRWSNDGNPNRVSMTAKVSIKVEGGREVEGGRAGREGGRGEGCMSCHIPELCGHGFLR